MRTGLAQLRLALLLCCSAVVLNATTFPPTTTRWRERRPTSSRRWHRSWSAEIIAPMVARDRSATVFDARADDARARRSETVVDVFPSSVDYLEAAGYPPRRSDERHQRGSPSDERISAIKQMILSKLGYERAPEPAKANISAAEMTRVLQMYRDSMEQKENSERTHAEHEQPYSAETFHSITDEGDAPPGYDDATWRRGVRVYFHATAQPETHAHMRVSSAKLKIFKAVIPPPDGDTGEAVARISVYAMPAPGGAADARTLVDTQTVRGDESGWETFDVTAAVRRWMLPSPNDNATRTNYGLELTCRPAASPACRRLYFVPAARGRCYGRLLLARLLSRADFAPTLNVLTYEEEDEKEEEEEGRRGKRGKGDCGGGPADGLCCRSALYVSFKEIGWSDWIFAPAGYDAFACRGRCPQRHGMLYKPAHAHAVIQAAMHAENPAAAPLPSCVPKSMGHLAMVHLDSASQLVITSLGGMVVGECACT